MVLTVWGEWHMNVFLNYHLRTLLSPNNFPEFSKTFETIFFIFATGPDQKIISENEARRLNPDYFFVMPYAFIKEFIKREKKWLKKGGKFILPYPNFKIINK